jgi:hypothetical protein
MDVAASCNGSTMVAVEQQGMNVFVSSDEGGSWWPRQAVPAAPGKGAPSYQAVAVSCDGSKAALVGRPLADSTVWLSTDAGKSWRQKISDSRAWTSLAFSSTGTTLVATTYGGLIYTNSLSSAAVTARASVGKWAAIASSDDGARLAAVVRGGYIYTSANGGASWAQTASVQEWVVVASSGDGIRLVAAAYGGYIYVSRDAGANWSAADQPRNWFVVAMVNDGSKMAAAEFGGRIYISIDAGKSWKPTASSSLMWRGLAMWT